MSLFKTRLAQTHIYQQQSKSSNNCGETKFISLVAFHRSPHQCLSMKYAHLPFMVTDQDADLQLGLDLDRQFTRSEGLVMTWTSRCEEETLLPWRHCRVCHGYGSRCSSWAVECEAVGTRGGLKMIWQLRLLK